MTRLSHFTFIRILLLGIGLILTIDALVLFSMLKINFGTIVPFIIGIIFIIHALFWRQIYSVLYRSKWLKRIWTGLWELFTLWLISFVVFIGILLQQTNQPTDINNLDAVIVLGAGVNGDTPTDALASRLDKAVEVTKNNPNIVIIMSGGVGISRKISEAQIMANYLHDSYGIALESIKLETRSTSTETNLEYSKLILEENKIAMSNHIAIVTNDFHTIRAKAIATKIGYKNVTMVASKTPLSIRFNAWFREYFAFISGWLLNEYEITISYLINK